MVKIMRSLIGGLALIGLSNCATPTQEPPTETNTEPTGIKIVGDYKEGRASSDACSAKKWQNYIGQDYATNREAFPKHRWKKIGYKYTEDFRPNRLNIKTNDETKITAIGCG